MPTPPPTARPLPRDKQRQQQLQTTKQQQPSRFGPQTAGEYLSGTIEKLQLFHSYTSVCLDTLSAKANDPQFQERIHRRVTYPLLLLKFTSHHLLNSFNSLILYKEPPSSSSSSPSPFSSPKPKSPQQQQQPPQTRQTLISEIAKFLRLLRSNWTRKTILKAIQLTPSVARDTAQILFSLAGELIARLALTTDLLSMKFGNKGFVVPPPPSKSNGFLFSKL